MKYGTVYLITVDRAHLDGYTETPFRLYATREKADRFINRLKRHYSKLPTPPKVGEATDSWVKALKDWRAKHPGGEDLAGTALDDWRIKPMVIC